MGTFLSFLTLTGIQSVKKRGWAGQRGLIGMVSRNSIAITSLHRLVNKDEQNFLFCFRSCKLFSQISLWKTTSPSAEGYYRYNIALTFMRGVYKAFRHVETLFVQGRKQTCYWLAEFL